MNRDSGRYTWKQFLLDMQKLADEMSDSAAHMMGSQSHNRGLQPAFIQSAAHAPTVRALLQKEWLSRARRGM